ncbi:NAD(P)-dependent oxidoreductase [Polaromonas sp. CG_23.6]|uniref:NAD-dependent epimerase/dehydratase family protein n=1 Tax=Polaromonas sp. CG_23.6 TaxID=2760709 RepID=UPI00247669FF|nr:NAD(P)-dependent oxidoreductase [Polaromonas sp. CG_23.6]MDH6186724.1 nucleoside-diphosphate-sugar epimerase [Polaromonas sp. CG_23.6]
MVTGAAGLVGSSVARRLLNAGAEVVAVDRVGAENLEGVQVIACDLGDIHRLHQLAGEQLDGVIHCGAFSGPMVARDQPYSMVQVNVVGTANMLELARIHRARRFVYCSSTSVYGQTQAGPVIEETLLRPASLYGASKVASEYLVDAYAHQYGLDGVSIRLSWVYGPRRSTDCVIRTMIEDAQSGRPTRMAFGKDFPRQYIHVDDAVSGLLLAYETQSLARRSYNVTGGTRVTLEDVAEIVRKIFPAADIALQPGADPVDEIQHEFDISSAGTDLGYSPMLKLEDGLRHYANWLDDQSKRGRSGTQPSSAGAVPWR